MEIKGIHEAVGPLNFLIGKWRSVSAEGKFPPRVKPFKYAEEIEFVSLGQPMLNYKSTSWHPERGNPMHLESGFMKIKPGTDQVSFVVAHNFGLTSVEEGNVTGSCVRVKSAQIGRCSFNKEPAVERLERVIELIDGKLKIVTSMGTSLQELQEHLVVLYEKVV